MADTKRGRERQARQRERRRIERELKEERERLDEPEPDDIDEDEPDVELCHRRGCDRPAVFLVRERYREETGTGTVEADAALCAEHTAEEGPTNLEVGHPDYLFQIVPHPATIEPDES